MSLKLSCPKHPRYTAKISPRANCDYCMTLYQIAIRCGSERIKVN